MGNCRITELSTNIVVGGGGGPETFPTKGELWKNASGCDFVHAL